MFLTDGIVARPDITANTHGAAPVIRFAQTNAGATAKAVTPAHNAANLLPVVDQADIQPKQRILADKVLRALPEGCRQELQNLYVNYEKNPSNRGLGGGSEGL